MQLIPYFIFFSILTVEISWSANFLKTSKADEVYTVFDAMINILKYCYANQTKTVGLAGHSPEILIKKLSARISLPVTLIDGTTRLADNQPTNWKSKYPLQIFVITQHSPTDLQEILSDIKASLWWNHMASLFILEMPLGSRKGCSKAFQSLMTTWQMNLLHAKVICLHPTRGRLVYSYNPYTGNAPDPWQLENTYKAQNGHPWSLYQQRYVDYQICDELDFDKTNDLGGYEIRSTVKNITASWYIIPNKTGIDSFGGFSGITAQFLFRALNATPKLLQHSSPDGFSHDQKKGSDIAIDAINGISDIGLNFRYQLSLENVTTTYPHWHGGLGALTQYNGYESELIKFRSILDIKSQYGVYFTILITIIFFRYFQSFTLISAILNTLRIICNSSLPKLPKNQAARFYLAGLFLVTITIQVYYGGRLASILTKPAHLPNVNTKQDLIKSRHTLYVYKMDATFVNESAFAERYVKLNDVSCIQHVLRNSSIACMMERQLMVDEALDLKLHISREIIEKISYIYVIRSDWPLEQRVNKILAALYESDIIWQVSMGGYRNASNILKMNKKLEPHEKFEVITMQQLTFAFVIFWFGLTCATITFLVEVAINNV